MSSVSRTTTPVCQLTESTAPLPPHIVTVISSRFAVAVTPEPTKLIEEAALESVTHSSFIISSDLPKNAFQSFPGSHLSPLSPFSPFGH